MRKLVNKTFFLLTVLMCVVATAIPAYASEDYKLLNPKKEVDPYQNLTFTYNVELDKHTVNNNTIFVVDREDSLLKNNVILSKDKKTVIIEAPKGGYKAGEEYFLCLTNEVLSINGKQSTKSSIMPFTIKAELVDYNVNIVVNNIQMPTSWTKSPINGYVVPLDKDQMNRTVQVIEEAVSKYPPYIVNKNLKNIYLVKEMGFYGVKFGGTRSSDSVYITSQKSYSDESIEQLFHAEFSSILWKNYQSDFDSKKWAKLNPSGFTYTGTGVDALKINANGNFANQEEKVLLRNGFLTEYAMSSLENDFNSFTKLMFLGDPTFWDKVDNYSQINKKFDLVIDFYASLDSTFTEEYFRSFMD